MVFDIKELYFGFLFFVIKLRKRVSLHKICLDIIQQINIDKK